VVSGKWWVVDWFWRFIVSRPPNPPILWIDQERPDEKQGGSH